MERCCRSSSIIERKLDLKPLTLQVVHAGLAAVVNEPGGTAYRQRLPDLKFAGKTGTAQVVTLGAKQKLKVDTQAYLSRDNAWFASYAPAADPRSWSSCSMNTAAGARRPRRPPPRRSSMAISN